MSDQFYKLPTAGQSDTFMVLSRKGQRSGQFGPQHLIEIRKNGQTMLYTPKVDSTADKFLMANIGKSVSIVVTAVPGQQYPNYDWSLQTGKPDLQSAPTKPDARADAWAERDKVKQKSIEKTHDENIRQASFELAVKLTEMGIIPDVVKPLAYQIYDLIVNDGTWANLKKSDWKARGEANGEARGEANGEARGEANGEARGEANGEEPARKPEDIPFFKYPPDLPES